MQPVEIAKGIYDVGYDCNDDNSGRIYKNTYPFI